VLEEAVAQMRKHGRPQCKMANLFMDFKGIQVTLAVMMRVVIDGRIDCKTAGRRWCSYRPYQSCCGCFTAKDAKTRKKNIFAPDYL
jgi:hypothetical protein